MTLRYRMAWLLALALAATACGDDDGTTPDAGGGEDAAVPMDGSSGEDAGSGETGQLRVWHLAAAAGDVDVFVDGEAFLEGFSFEANTAYTELPAGSYDIAVAPAGEGIGAAVIEVDGFALGAGESWTIVAAQLDGDASAEGAFQALPILEDTTAPDAGNVKFRLFHASYVVGNAVDVHDLTQLTAPQIAEGLAQGTVAEDALEVPVAAYTFGFDVGAAADRLGDTDGIVDLLSGALDEPVDGALITAGVISKPGEEAGEVETELVFLIGDGENIHDESELEAAANARVWHLAPEAGAVDVYLNDALALEDFAFEGNTPYLPFREGTVDIAVVPADGDPATDAVIEVADYALDAGTYHTIVAWQQDEDETADGAFQPLAIQEDREPPADGSIKVRVFHASFLVGNAVDVYDMADTSEAALEGLAQGAVSADALELPNTGAYTFGLDIDATPDGTVDLEMAMPLDMPLDGSFVTLGVLSKPEAGEVETEVVFLVNNGLHDEIELAAP